MSDERRRGTRLMAEVKVDYRTVGSFITDYSKDISQGGLFIATSLPLEIGEQVRLRITLPGRDLPFALEGVVRWNSKPSDRDQSPAGMGIEFINFDAEVRAELSRFVATLPHEEDKPK
jgi:type IV pilus assembly protein PilZ